MKPLRSSGFAGMLPPTMSQGNDAFPPKDAEPAVNSDASAPVEREPSPSASADVEAKSSSDKSSSDKSSSDKSSSDKSSSDKSSSDKSSSDKSSSDKTKHSSSAPKASKTVDDEDTSDDKNADDRDDSDSDAAVVERSRKPRSQKERRRRSARDEEDDEEQLQPPETEEAINVPKMQTVYMLGAMSTLLVILWFAAKLTCNVHPDQVRDPKHFSTKDLAADPKNAAFEFHQRYEMADFVTAYDLATAEMKQTVEAKLKDCEQHADDCAKTQEKLAGTVQSSVKLLDRTADRATVEMTSFYRSTTGAANPPKSFSMTVVKEGDFWRVSSRREIPTVAEAPPVAVGAVNAAPATNNANAANNAANVAAPMETAPPAPVEQAPAQ